MNDVDITTELTAGTRQVLDVYDAALDVVASWLDVAPAARDRAHTAAVVALARALAVVGVLERGSTLDPAAVVRLSPRVQPDAADVIGPAPDAG